MPLGLGHSFTLNVPHLPVILLERYQRSLGQGGGGHPSPSSSGDHGSPSAGKPLLGPFNAQTLSFVFFGCLSAANAIREFYAKRLARQTHNRDFVNAIQKVLDERDDNKRETASGSGDDNAQDTPRNFELVPGVRRARDQSRVVPPPRSRSLGNLLVVRHAQPTISSERREPLAMNRGWPQISQVAVFRKS